MPVTAREIIAYARAEEIAQNSSASGFTLLKFRRGAIDALVREARIGHLELNAAFEFAKIFHQITYLCGFKATSLREFQVDGSHHRTDDRPPDPEAEKEYLRYKEFSNYWSARRKRLGDPLLSVFVAAVVDEQPIEHIAQDNGLTVKKTERLLVHGLRDYARRAGWR